MGKFSGNGELIFMEDDDGIWEGMQGGGYDGVLVSMEGSCILKNGDI